MSFQFLSYKQLRANLLEFYNDEVKEYKLTDVINKTETTAKLDSLLKYKKAQLEAIHRFIIELDNTVSYAPVKPTVQHWLSEPEVDKRASQIEDHNISEQRKAKILTGKIKSLVDQLRKVEGQHLIVDANFLEQIPAIIGENRKNQFDEQAAIESHDALRLFKPISFAKLVESISHIESDRKELKDLQRFIKELNQDLVPNYLETHRSANKPWLEDEKTVIVFGKLLSIKKAYEGWGSSISGKKNSRLYKEILPVMGLLGEQVDETFALYAKSAYERYMFMKQISVEAKNAKEKEAKPAQSLTRLQAINAELKASIPEVQAVEIEAEGKKTIGTAHGIEGLRTPVEKRAPLTRSTTYLDQIEHFDKSVLGQKAISPEVKKSESTALKAYKSLSRKTLQRDNIAPQIRNSEEIELKPTKTVEKRQINFVDEVELRKAAKLNKVDAEQKQDRSEIRHDLLSQVRFNPVKLKPVQTVVKYGKIRYEDDVELRSLLKNTDQERLYDTAVAGDLAGFDKVMTQVKSFNKEDLRCVPKTNEHLANVNKLVLFKEVHKELARTIDAAPDFEPTSPAMTRK